MKEDQALKARIIECAARMVKGGGVKGLSIAGIAKECRISKSTFYSHFASKVALLECLKAENEIDPAELHSVRDRLIARAIEELSNNTFAETDMEQIAKSAGINRSTVYRYFANKEELLIAGIRNELTNRVRVLERIKSEENDPLRFAERYMDYFNQYANNPYTNLLYATMIYYSKKNAAIRESFDHLREYTVRLLTDNFEAGKDKGLFKKDFDSFGYAQMFFSVMSGIHIHAPAQFLEVSRKFLHLLYGEIAVDIQQIATYNGSTI